MNAEYAEATPVQSGYAGSLSNAKIEREPGFMQATIKQVAELRQQAQHAEARLGQLRGRLLGTSEPQGTHGIEAANPNGPKSVRPEVEELAQALDRLGSVLSDIHSNIGALEQL